jgi:threonine dehydratase
MILPMQNPGAELELPELADIEAARERLHGLIHRTPLLTSRSLGEGSGSRVFLKCENLQRAGSFKIRGALNACLLAREAGTIGPAGVLTYSSGNHGQAVALAARLLGFEATVLVPEDISSVKEAAIGGYGGRVVRCGLTSNERYEGALRLSRETGAHIIHPYDHPHIIAGQGTAGLELVEDFEARAELPAGADPDVVLVPVGGGGLIAGIAIAVASLRPALRVIGVEPETADALARSLAAGERVALPRPPRTIADGLRALTPGRLTYLAARRHVPEVLRVADETIRRAQRLLLERAKLLVEPSGAVPAAALLEHAERFRGLAVALLLSGGNAEAGSLG